LKDLFPVSYQVKDSAQEYHEGHSQWEKAITPHRWLDDLRLADAKAKLANVGKISAIASELGFASGSQFSNWFFRSTGIRPSDFLNRKSKA
jgi:AraC-like DNA-binding protein